MCVARASRALSHLSRPNLLTDLLECVDRLSGDLWPRVLLTCDRKRHPQLTERLNGLVPCVVVLSADAQVPDLHQSCKSISDSFGRLGRDIRRTCIAHRFEGARPPGSALVSPGTPRCLRPRTLEIRSVGHRFDRNRALVKIHAGNQTPDVTEPALI